MGSEPARSRVPVLAAGAALALVLAVGGAFAWRALRPAPAVAPEVDTRALQAALVESQLELARLSLANKSYEEATRQADEALRLDPVSSEARGIRARAQAALQERDAAVAEGRAALARDDVPAASRALTKLLALDPRHPATGELSSALNASFRGQASEARAALAAARTAAVRSDAWREPAFLEAEKLSREGDALLKTSEYAVATQRYVQARDGYAQAQRAGEATARRAAEAQRQADLQRQSETQRQVEAQRVAEAQRQAEARRAAEEQQRAAQRQAQATPSATSPVAPPASAATTPAPAGAEAAIRQVLADYARAIESKDVALFASVKPNLSADERHRLEAAFKAIKSQQVRISIEAVQVAGAMAAVRASRQDTVNGRAQPPLKQTFRLTLGPAGWKIDSIGQ